MTDKISTHVWKIREIDIGYDRIVFQAYLDEEPVYSYICIQMEAHPVLLSFEEEPIDYIKSFACVQQIEIPIGNSGLETKVREFILGHSQLVAPI